jgi:hypothetical protein
MPILIKKKAMALNSRSKSIGVYHYTFKEVDVHFAINFLPLFCSYRIFLDPNYHIKGIPD